MQPEPESSLSHLSNAELESIKSDLEQRLARFQRAFQEQHGRNPDEEERKPAKPAIKKYRQVCAELADRSKAATAAASPRGPGTAMAEIGAGAAQTGGSVQSGNDAVREMTRKVVAQAASFTSTMGGSATLTLLFEWGQLTAIWGDVSVSTATMLREQNPALDVAALGAWVGDLEETLFRWVQIFNLDVEAFRANFDFTFLSMIGWREAHLGFTVFVPLFLSAVTVCLLFPLGVLARLALLVCSALLLIFGMAAHVLLARGKEIRDTEESAILGIDTDSLNTTLVVGAGMFLLAVFAMIWLRIDTYRRVRKLLEAEVDKLSEQLYDIKEGVKSDIKGSRNSKTVQEDLPNAGELKSMLESDHQTHLIGGRAANAEDFLRQMQDAEKQKKIDEQGRKMPDFYSFVKLLSLWLVVSVIAMVLWLRVGELLPQGMMESLPEEYANNYYILAVVLSGISLAILFYQFMSLTDTGTKIVDAIVDILKSGYVGFLMTTVLILYIPISKQALSVFVCDEHNCAQDEWFPVQSPGTGATLGSYIGSFADSYTSIAEALVANSNETTIEALAPPSSCQDCQWLGHCPSHLSAQLCAPSTSLRLVASPAIDCGQQWAFYMPGALLTLLMFTFGVPYMFYQLTRRHTEMYSSLQIYEKKKGQGTKKPASNESRVRTIFSGSHDDYSQYEVDDMWLRRVRQAKRNRAKNLYADFEYDWRFWKLVMLIVKFLVILVDAVKTQFDSPMAAPILMLLIHSCMLMLSVYARPYTDKRPDLLSLSITFANVFNWAALFLFAAQITAPAWMIWMLIVVNVVFPILFMCVGYCLNVRKKKARDLELKETTLKYKKPADVMKQRMSIERVINETTLRFISRWTWGVLICCVIGGELIFIGTFAEAALTPVTGHTSSGPPITHEIECYKETYARAQEFIGFNNWQNFTDNCCCMSRANVTDPSDNNVLNTHVMELWACVNDNPDVPVVYKERQRRDLEPGSRIAPVRQFCGRHFFADYTRHNDPRTADVEWNDDLQKLGVRIRDQTGTALEFIDDYW